MDRSTATDDPNGILDPAVHHQIPIIADPTQAAALLSALTAALAAGSDVQAEFRAGSLWDRKGYDTGGDFSPLVDPSPYRGSDPLADEVYLSVAVRIENPSATPELRAFIENQRRRSECDQLAKLEAQSAQHQQARDAEQSTLDNIEARAAELRAAIDQ